MPPGRYTSPNKELMLLCRGNVYQRVLSVVITAVISTPVFANICQECLLECLLSIRWSTRGQCWASNDQCDPIKCWCWNTINTDETKTAGSKSVLDGEAWGSISSTWDYQSKAWTKTHTCSKQEGKYDWMGKQWTQLKRETDNQSTKTQDRYRDTSRKQKGIIKEGNLE